MKRKILAGDPPFWAAAKVSYAAFFGLIFTACVVTGRLAVLARQQFALTGSALAFADAFVKVAALGAFVLMLWGFASMLVKCARW